MTFELENCCYCVDLKTGALILGYMSGFKPKCVKAYLIYIGIYINITFGLLIASIIIGTEVRFVIRDLVQLLISFYTLLIVRSYYKVMNFPPQKPMIFHTYNNVEMTQRSQPECDQRGEPKALACERRQRASSEMDMVY
ncbi:uncharacterized protein LOC142977316 isoform X2 [Anticarsia gemmatalis]|uniref:uncharacterized protein LOC142977316 isoform X2 n=1 Tax=Anticarsia gemmatalis TaxID=129554 RepID=UPI003F75BD9D